MAKIKRNEELLGMYEAYALFLDSDKTVAPHIVISEPKKNHETSLYASYPIDSTVAFGKNMSMTCEVRNGDPKDCSFQILSDAFKKSVVFRYDTGGGTHRNDAPHIPLEEQSITTPHFHKYDSGGYFLAYKTDVLNDPKQVQYLFDIDFAFPYFCAEGRIKSNTEEGLPDIQIRKNGCLPFSEEEDEDPLNGINFD